MFWLDREGEGQICWGRHVIHEAPWWTAIRMPWGVGGQIYKMGISRVFHFKESYNERWEMSLQPCLGPEPWGLLLCLRGFGSVVLVVDLKTLKEPGLAWRDVSGFWSQSTEAWVEGLVPEAWGSGHPSTPASASLLCNQKKTRSPVSLICTVNGDASVSWTPTVLPLTSPIV